MFSPGENDIDLFIQKDQACSLSKKQRYVNENEICSTEECKLDRSIKPYALDIDSKNVECTQETPDLDALGVDI